MCYQYLKFVVIVLFGAVGIVANESSSTEPEVKNAEVIKEYLELDNTSFVYRYYFDDGSIVSQAGKFKVVSIASDTPINTPQNKYDTLYGFGKGYIRFIIRRQMYEFNYDIDEDIATGILTFVSSNGTTAVEEIYNQTTTDGYWYYAGLNTPESRHKMIPFNEYSFYAINPPMVHIALRFPSNANHISFGCEFTAQLTSNHSQFSCKTFENSTVTTVGFTANEADMAWIDEQSGVINNFRS